MLINDARQQDCNDLRKMGKITISFDVEKNRKTSKKCKKKFIKILKLNLPVASSL